METKDNRGAERLEAMTQMMMGFRVTQLLYVAAKLGIADLLRIGLEVRRRWRERRERMSGRCTGC